MYHHSGVIHARATSIARAGTRDARRGGRPWGHDSSIDIAMGEKISRARASDASRPRGGWFYLTSWFSPACTEIETSGRLVLPYMAFVPVVYGDRDLGVVGFTLHGVFHRCVRERAPIDRRIAPIAPIARARRARETDARDARARVVTAPMFPVPNAMPSMEDARRAYEAKKRLDALDATYDVSGRARAVSDAASRATDAVSAAFGSLARRTGNGGGDVGGGGGATRGTAAERRWTCHACERLDGGGRGEMISGFIVQPSGVPMAMLEVRGEVVERCALPMGKDELVKGEMLTFGKWLARVVGLEGATPEKPRVVVRPPNEETTARMDAGATATAATATAATRDHRAVDRYGGRQPVVVDEPNIATQPRAGGIEPPGARREYYHDPNAQARGAYHQQPAYEAPPKQAPRYQIYDPAPRYERGVDPDTGERERWMAGGWRGRGTGDDRPRPVTREEVEAARSRLLQLEQEARIRAEVAAAEALARQQAAESARLSAETAMEQMSQAEAANRAVREAEVAAAEAKRLAYFAAENQREAESQFISTLDGAESTIEAQHRVSELDEIQRRIAEHERAAAEHTLAPPPTQRQPPPQHQYAPQQPPPKHQYAPQKPQQQHQYAPQQPQQQYQYVPQQPPPQYQYVPQQPQQQHQYAPQQPPQHPSYQQHQQPPAQQYAPPAPQSVQQYASVRHDAPTPQPQVQRRAEAEVEYTTSPSNVKERAAAFGQVTIKPKPASPAANPSVQTYSNTGTSTTSASAHALAQIMRQERPEQSKKAETPEELKRKIEILQRLARSRGINL